MAVSNNNPGNLRHSTDQWEGMDPVQADPRFVSFVDLDHGVRALAKVLATYQDKGIDTLAGIISRYAPPGENDTAAYIKAVAKQTGFGANDRINARDPATSAKLIAAIAKHEEGVDLDPGAVDRGVRLAFQAPLHDAPGAARYGARGVTTPDPNATPDLGPGAVAVADAGLPLGPRVPVPPVEVAPIPEQGPAAPLRAPQNLLPMGPPAPGPNDQRGDTTADITGGAGANPAGTFRGQGPATACPATLCLYGRPGDCRNNVACYCTA